LFLDLRIVKELRVRFADLRILKQLASSEQVEVSSRGGEKLMERRRHSRCFRKNGN
jgi:hypothetical protein